ncbi:hypothetical protein Mapa_005223 [Marchantia paleacea]|nr:hypothetical protein Mapa_005223 [Marchantia paleacea]
MNITVTTPMIKDRISINHTRRWVQDVAAIPPFKLPLRTAQSSAKFAFGGNCGAAKNR